MLKGKTVFITGASRGIGEELGIRFAREGANIVVAAKTAEPHPTLPGTIYTAAKKIEEAGGKALPVVVDVRDEQQIERAVKLAVDTFGGIDILVNNASAINLASTDKTPMKKYDLMMQVNVRGTFATTKACLPYLKKAANPHVLIMSPPLDLNPRFFEACGTAYCLSKTGMSMCVLGMSEEFRKDKIAFNALWPRVAVETAALSNFGEDSAPTRSTAIMGDAALEIVLQQSDKCTGNFFMDEDLLMRAGMTLDEINKKYNNCPADTKLPEDFELEKKPLEFFRKTSPPKSKL